MTENKENMNNSFQWSDYGTRAGNKEKGCSKFKYERVDVA